MRFTSHPTTLAAGLAWMLALFSPCVRGQTGPVLPTQTNLVLNGLMSLVVTNTAHEAGIPPGQENQLVRVDRHYPFTYANRQALLADGWSFQASKGGVTRDTEVTNASQGLMIDYNQTAHPGTVNIPCDIGDFFEISNNRAHPARNFLTRALPTNWLEINLSMTFTPATFIQQAGLGLYQDDDNYNWVSLAWANWRPSHMLPDGSPDNNPVNGGGDDPTHREVWAIEAGGILPQSVFSTVYCPHTHLYGFYTGTYTLRIDKTTTNYWCPTCVQAYWSPWAGFFPDIGDPGQLTGYNYPPQLTNPRICIWTGCLPPAVPGAVNMGLQDLEVISLEPLVTLTYQLLAAPDGAGIDASGIISWTPTAGQIPSTNVFTTIVHDNGSPPVWATNSFTVVVQDVNAAPVLPVQADRVVNLPSTLTVTNTATEADPNALPLSYLLTTAPLGATISTNGIISWAPGPALVYTTNLFVTVVTNYDPLASNEKSLSATNSFRVVVLPPPYPVLPSQPDYTVRQFNTLTVTNTAVDGALTVNQIVTNTILFNYANRAGLLADGWSFMGSNPDGSARNTEYPIGAGMLAYNQGAPPGALNIPCDVGDLYSRGSGFNNTRNSLFRSLPSNWQSIRLSLNFAPVTANYQQAHLGLYQDDDNYLQMGVAFNGNESFTLDNEIGGVTTTAARVPTTSTSLNFRLDQNPGTSTVTAYYSLDGVTWTALGTVNLALTNPRLVIWTGSYQLPYAAGGAILGLQRLDIVTSTTVPTALSYSLLNPPAGAAIDGNGIFSWTPDATIAPGPYVLTTVVTDNGLPPLGATNSFNVVVVPNGNVPPVLPAQADRTLNFPSTLTVTNTATEADPNALPLSYQLITAPLGATISANGIISWTPGPALVYTTNLFVTVVTNYDPLASNAQSLSATNSFKVVVLPPPYPMLLPQPDYTVRQFDTLRVTNTAVDGATTVNQIVTNTIGFNYANRAALLADGWSFMGANPDGSARNTEYPVGAGMLAYNQGAPPGALNIPCDVGDLYGNNPSVNNTRNSLFRGLPSDWQSLRLALNFAPVAANYQQAHLGLYQDDNNYLQMGVAFNSYDGNERFTLDSETGGVAGTAAEVPTASTALNFRLDRAPGTSTVTAYYSSDGLTWTVLGTLNLALANPRVVIWTGSYQLPYAAGGAIMSLQHLDIVNGAAVSTALHYSLLNPPTGVTIDSNGVISWTPDATIAPGPYVLTTVVTDNSLPPLGATNSFTVQVTPAHNGPSLPAQPDVTIAQYSTLQVTNTAADTDLPFPGLSYSLPVAPVGATIDSNGVITWTPGAGQGHTTNLFTTVVIDGAASPLSATNRFNVVVNEINLPPTLGSPANQTLGVHQTLRVTNAASAPDMPPVTLSYQLSGPEGSAIDSSGVITWTPLLPQAPSTNLFQTVVTNWNPWAVNTQSLSATNTFLVTVLPPPPPPAITASYLKNGQLVLSWQSDANQIYRLQYCDDLRSNTWENVTPDVAADGSAVAVTNALDVAPARFFRLLLLP